MARDFKKEMSDIWDAGVTPLDQAWERINALGGTTKEYDDFGRGINHAVDQALAIIEELGGSDPAPKRAKTEAA
jgi:hypothetical protein